MKFTPGLVRAVKHMNVDLRINLTELFGLEVIVRLACSSEAFVLRDIFREGFEPLEFSNLL